MKVLIDADGCPVVQIAVSLCKKYRVCCWLLCDTAHDFSMDGAQTLVFDQGRDSVDFSLVNRINPGDIVITQDYGLASMCLSRLAVVLHQDGWAYTRDNIDALLLVRHDSRKHRLSGGRMKGGKKRTALQDDAFRSAFEDLLQNTVQG